MTEANSAKQGRTMVFWRPENRLIPESFLEGYCFQDLPRKLPGRIQENTVDSMETGLFREEIPSRKLPGRQGGRILPGKRLRNLPFAWKFPGSSPAGRLRISGSGYIRIYPTLPASSTPGIFQEGDTEFRLAPIEGEDMRFSCNDTNKVCRLYALRVLELPGHDGSDGVYDVVVSKQPDSQVLPEHMMLRLMINLDSVEVRSRGMAFARWPFESIDKWGIDSSGYVLRLGIAQRLDAEAKASAAAAEQVRIY